jgi:hypothetical protein
MARHYISPPVTYIRPQIICSNCGKTIQPESHHACIDYKFACHDCINIVIQEYIKNNSKDKKGNKL